MTRAASRGPPLRVVPRPALVISTLPVRDAFNELCGGISHLSVTARRVCARARWRGQGAEELQTACLGRDGLLAGRDADALTDNALRRSDASLPPPPPSPLFLLLLPHERVQVLGCRRA